MEARVKAQVMTFFKIGGFSLRSEVALLLVEKIKDLDENERKEFIERIFSSIQNQTLETASIEKDNMTAAIRVRSFVVIILNLLNLISGMQPRSI